jgi:hypothetical protein
MAMTTMDLHFRLATAEDWPALQAIRLAAFAPVFSSFRALLGDELYELVQAREDAAQGDLLVSLLEQSSPWEVHVAVAGDRMKAASVSTGADASHAAARRAYAKVGFTAHVPSVWYCRML